jgi:type I restriction enzyme S subunit
MGRLTNARRSHIERWVVPAARKLLIDAAARLGASRPLEGLAEIEMGQSPPGESCNTNQQGAPLIGGPADLGLIYPNAGRWTSAPTKQCRPGDIIVCVRATIGEPRWADKVYCLGRGVAAARPRDSSLDARFLFHVIEGNEKSLREKGTGTTFKTISKQHLASIPIPIIPLNQ